MEVVTRKQWGAREPRDVTLLPAERIRFLVVHYSGADADEQSEHRNCPGRVRAIQRFHMDTQGWADIAYNWLVCKHGFIFRGRGWEQGGAVRSAATGAANSYTVAVCFLGNDTAGRDDVTDAGREALREVWRFVKRNAPHVEGGRGHRDFMATACPGLELWGFARALT